MMLNRKRIGSEATAIGIECTKQLNCITMLGKLIVRISREMKYFEEICAIDTILKINKDKNMLISALYTCVLASFNL